MTRPLRISLAVLLLCVYAAVTTRPADAQTGTIGPTKSQVVWIFVAVGAVGAAIAVGVYYSIHKSPTLTGCAVAGASGLTLNHEGDHDAFLLIGDTAGIKPGDRIQVKGRKRKQDASGNRSFLVESLKKDYGPCPVSAP